MAVLQKTRIKGLLTAEVGIDITGGILSASNADINTISSNNITTSSISSGNITLSNRLDASAASATFNLINSNTYEGLPEAVAGGVKGIVSITDSYTSLSSGLVPTTTALNYFRNDFQSEIIGNDDDPSTAETMKGLKNYVKENVITSGVVNVSSKDPAITPSINIGSGTITLNIPTWALQSSLNNVQKSLNDLSDLVDSLTGGQSTRLDDLEAAVYGTESAPGLQTFIPSVLYSQADTVLDLINNQINDLAITKIDNVESTITSRIDTLESNTTSNLNSLESRIADVEGEIPPIEERLDDQDGRISSMRNDVDLLLSSVASIPYRFDRKIYNGNKSSAAGKIRVTLGALGFENLNSVSNYVFLPFLNGFYLKSPKYFPSGTESPTMETDEIVFYRGSTVDNSYIETANTLIAGQEFSIVAFGFNNEDFSLTSQNSIRSFNLLSNEEINKIKTSSKLKW